MATSESGVTDAWRDLSPLLDQDDLDLTVRERTSLYPWRGQFSPDLVANLLERYAAPGDVVLDPFAGSGTVLFEAARRDLEAHGLEINPAAILFSRIAGFSALDESARVRKLGRVERRLQAQLGAGADADALPRLVAVLRALDPASLEYAALATSALLAMRDSSELNVGQLRAAHAENVDLISRLAFAERSCATHMADARRVPLPSGSVDLVVTSPPYINVFNYHQNYRKAMEVLGWAPLTIATAEIGANRKHRGNRFKTVVQYCIDMVLALAEMSRVLDADGRAVIVVGYESRVRGLPFYNAALLSALAQLVGMEIEAQQRRRFVSRFGTSVREDLLTMRKSEESGSDIVGAARQVGVAALERASRRADDDTRADLRAAIEGAGDIIESPLPDFARATPDGERVHDAMRRRRTRA